MLGYVLGAKLYFEFLGINKGLSTPQVGKWWENCHFHLTKVMVGII